MLFVCHPKFCISIVFSFSWGKDNAYAKFWPLQKVSKNIIMLFVCHPKFCISIVFIFSWGRFNSQEKLKTMLMQNFGVTNKEHYGILWYFLKWSILRLHHSKGKPRTDRFFFPFVALLFKLKLQNHYLLSVIIVLM